MWDVSKHKDDIRLLPVLLTSSDRSDSSADKEEKEMSNVRASDSEGRVLAGGMRRQCGCSGCMEHELATLWEEEEQEDEEEREIPVRMEDEDEVERRKQFLLQDIREAALYDRLLLFFPWPLSYS